MNKQEIQLSTGIAAFEAKEFYRAWQTLGPLSDAGVAEAQYRCAIMMQNGLGVPVQPQQAAVLMKHAADQSFGLAQHALGVSYLFGDGVDKNTPEAIIYLQLAGANGLAGAWSTLGMIFSEGQGVEKDPDRARKYYRKAGFDPDDFLTR